MRTHRSEDRKLSSNDHPRLLYLRGIEFWENNQFWERDTYTERGKEMLRGFLERVRNERLKKTMST